MAERMAAPERPSQFRGLITCKGVLWQQDTVVLLRNRRDEWELPGGKVDLGESFAAAFAAFMEGVQTSWEEVVRLASRRGRRSRLEREIEGLLAQQGVQGGDS